MVDRPRTGRDRHIIVKAARWRARHCRRCGECSADARPAGRSGVRAARSARRRINPGGTLRAACRKGWQSRQMTHPRRRVADAAAAKDAAPVGSRKSRVCRVSSVGCASYGPARSCRCGRQRGDLMASGNGSTRLANRKRSRECRSASASGDAAQCSAVRLGRGRGRDSTTARSGASD